MYNKQYFAKVLEFFRFRRSNYIILIINLLLDILYRFKDTKDRC